MHAGSAPRRAAMRSREKIAHSLREIPQRLLLHGLRPSRQPFVLGAGRCQLSALLVEAGRTAPWLPVLLLLEGQIPHIPRMAAMVAQHHRLLSGRKQPVSRHPNNANHYHRQVTERRSGACSLGYSRDLSLPHDPMTSSSQGPLAGVTVVAMEQAVAAPMCTRVLADFGARIIKVENPNGGDFARDYDDVVNGPGGLAAHFVWCNRGKESVTLNLKSRAGMEVLHRLLDRADALVSNLAPGSTARLGLSPADLAERHPNVIPVEIDGYGPGGPISHKRAYDLLIQAEGGSCAVTGYPGMPAKPGPAMADFTTGLYAALSILALLFSRDRREGPAPAVGLSLFDVLTDVMGYQLTYTQHSGIDQQPLGVGSPAVAPYGAFPTRDGQTVVLGTTNDREWQRVAKEIIDRPDLADDPRFATNPGRCAHREILDEAIKSWCAQHDLAHIQKVADQAGIGNSRYNLPSEVVVHPQLAARNRWREVDTTKGPIQALLPPPVIGGYDPPMGAVPGLGQHTDAVLAELGFGQDVIAEMREHGAIGPAYRS